MAHTLTRSAVLARTFHALSDDTRLQIVDCLLDGERCVCELTDTLNAGQSRLSFHLKVLKDAGLVTDRRDGRWVYYALAPNALDDAREFLGEFHHSATAPTFARKLPVRKTAAACCD
jgi:ArsR family transcriptional regulator